MAPRTGARVIGQSRVLTKTAVFCAPSWPRPPAARAVPSGAVLAAAASVGWCEAGTWAPGSRAAEIGGAQVTCGLWLARRRLVVAVLGREGGPRRVIRAALTDDARFGLIEYLTAVGAELVSTEALTRVDLTPVQAVRRGLSVWTAGDALVAALLGAAAIRDPVRAAALLARLPAIPLLRSSIRRLAVPDRRQLPLL
jgi:hypothetical protein